MYLAIDIGGTKTLLALFSPKGKVLRTFRFLTPEDSDQFIFELSQSLQPFRQYEIAQIVVAIPGKVYHKYSFRFGNRDWLNLDLFSPLKNLFHCPIQFFNDANLATTFEARNLPGRSIYLTFSTGIGGGIAKDGQLSIRLSNQFEPGHRQYIWQGQKLEWEDIASARAIGAAYQTLATSVRGRTAYADIARRLSLGLTDIIREYRPDTIILGGPLAELFPKFIRPLRRELKTSLLNSTSTLSREAAPSHRSPSVVLPNLIPAEYPQASVIHGCFLIAQEAAGDAE